VSEVLVLDRIGDAEEELGPSCVDVFTIEKLL
jgi:hypothetical protein